MSRTNVRLAGLGGQGIILAGVIIAKAAVEQDGIYATQTQSYGAESRGGASMADVILSKEQIDFPESEDLNILVAMSQSALDQHAVKLVPSGTLIVDPDMVTKVPARLGGPTYSIRATRTAVDLGRRVAANMVMLGATVRLTGIVSLDGLVSAVEKSVPSREIDLNQRAIQSGIALAEELIS